MKRREVDFILVNPYIYVQLERDYNIAHIVTMKNLVADKGQIVFGGVIFVRSDSPIDSLKRLWSKRFAAVDQTSLGG